MLYSAVPVAKLTVVVDKNAIKSFNFAVSEAV
jgi:hypothetical protein